MKIITYSVSEWDEDLQRYVTVEEESYDYEGPVAMAGGSSGGGTTVQKSEPPDYVKPHWEETLQGAGDLYQGGGQQYFPSQTYAPQTGFEQQGIGMQAQGAYGGQQVAGGLRGATNFGLSPQALYGNPYLQSHIEKAQRPTMQNFEENVLPNIRRHAVGTGGFDSTRRGIAEGIAARGATDTMGDIATRMSSEGYGQGLTHQARTMGSTPSSIQAMGLPGQMLYGAGQQQRAEGQLPIDDAMRRWDFSQQEPYEALRRYQDIISGTGAYGTSTSTSKQNSGGLLGGLFGGGGGGGGGSLNGLTTTLVNPPASLLGLEQGLF